MTANPSDTPASLASVTGPGSADEDLGSATDSSGRAVKRVSAVVLAGGRSSRFGRDKLAEPLDGATVLWWTIEALRGISDDIVVVVAPDGLATEPPDVRIVRDGEAHGGPLIGALTGLAATEHGTVLLTGGDMPWLDARVLRLMVASFAPAMDGVALGFDGRREQLPLALRRDAALLASTRLVGAGERRLGALLEALTLIVVPEVEWRRLDPAAATIRDIDTRGDLAI